MSRRAERLRIPAMTVALLFLFIGVTALVTILGDPYQMDFVSYWAAAQLASPAIRPAPTIWRFTARWSSSAIPLQALCHSPIRPASCSCSRRSACFPIRSAAFDWVLLTFAAYCAGAAAMGAGHALARLVLPAPAGERHHRPGRLPRRRLVHRRDGAAAEAPARRRHPARAVGGEAAARSRPALALLAGREWRAIAGAAASSIGLVLLSILVFGWAPYQAWLGNAGSHRLDRQRGLAGWHRMASVYGALRLAGPGERRAWIVHAVIALAAAGAACLIWYRKADSGRARRRAGRGDGAREPLSVRLRHVDPGGAVPLAGRAGAPSAAARSRWAILFLALVQVAGWSGGPNLMPLAPIVLLGLILLECVSRAA